jgi:hypothetical protein
MVAGVGVDTHSQAGEVSVGDSSLAAVAASAADNSFAVVAATVLADSSFAAVEDNGTAVAEDETGVAAAAIMAVAGVATTGRLTTAAMHMGRVIAAPAAITIAGETGSRTPAATRLTGINQSPCQGRAGEVRGIVSDPMLLDPRSNTMKRSLLTSFSSVTSFVKPTPSLYESSRSAAL